MSINLICEVLKAYFLEGGKEMRNIIFAIVISVVFIAGCNKNEIKNVNNVTSQKNDYVYQMKSKEPNNNNYDLTNLIVSSILIGDERLSIKLDDMSLSYLEIKGQKLIESRFISFDSVYPNISKPEFIIVTSNEAASCCPWVTFHIIVLRNGSPVLFSIDSTTVKDIKAKKSKSGGYDFIVEVESGVDKAGDSIIEELELLDTSNAILKKGLNNKFPGISTIIYPADFFKDKKLRSTILDFKDEEFLDARGSEGIEVPIKWIDSSALMMCFAPIKGEWSNSQIMVIDLETKGYEIQKITDGKLTSIKTGQQIIRNNIRESLRYTGKCFDTNYQAIKTETK